MSVENVNGQTAIIRGEIMTATAFARAVRARRLGHVSQLPIINGQVKLSVIGRADHLAKIRPFAHAAGLRTDLSMTARYGIQILTVWGFGPDLQANERPEEER